MSITDQINALPAPPADLDVVELYVRACRPKAAGQPLESDDAGDALNNVLASVATGLSCDVLAFDPALGAVELDGVDHSSMGRSLADFVPTPAPEEGV